MSDPVEQAAWDLVAMHGLRDGIATVMTTCEGVLVWLSHDAPHMSIPSQVGNVPVRVGRRPSFLRSDPVAVDADPEQAVESTEDAELA